VSTNCGSNDEHTLSDIQLGPHTAHGRRGALLIRFPDAGAQQIPHRPERGLRSLLHVRARHTLARSLRHMHGATDLPALEYLLLRDHEQATEEAELNCVHLE
jgi:hypothetical protein